MKKIISLLLAVLIASSVITIQAATVGDPPSIYSGAVDITTNPYTDAIENGKDSDFYKVVLESDGYISFEFDHPTTHEKCKEHKAYWIVTLIHNSHGVTLIDDYRIFADEGHTATHNIGLKAGQYYIRVTGENVVETREDYSDPKFGDYLPTVSYTISSKIVYADDWEQENNDSIDTANRISLNKTENGLISSDFDDDYYGFQLAEKKTLNITLAHPVINSSLNYFQATVFNEAGGKIKDINFKGNVASAVGKVSGLAAGKYFVRISGGDYQNYPLRSSDVEYKLTLTTSDYIPNVTGLKAVKQTVNSAKISWNKTAGATSYIVYRVDGSKYTQLAKTTALNYTAKKLSAAKTYTYAVKACKGTVLSEGYAKLSVSTLPKAVTGFKATAKKKSAKLTWKKVSGANGYIITYSTKKKSGYKTLKTITKGSTSTFTAKKLKPKKTYYFKITAYRNFGGKKLKSAVSSYKKCKIKK